MEATARFVAPAQHWRCKKSTDRKHDVGVSDKRLRNSLTPFFATFRLMETVAAMTFVGCIVENDVDLRITQRLVRQHKHPVALARFKPANTRCTDNAIARLVAEKYCEMLTCLLTLNKMNAMFDEEADSGTSVLTELLIAN